MSVPTRSKTPIIASSPAAATSVSPWSTAAGIRCVPISPLVVAPQMKKLALNSQNVRDPEAYTRPSPIAVRNGFPFAAGGAMSSSVAPNARTPIEDGRSRIRSAAER